MKRWLILSCIVVLIVSIMVIPAAALETVDYNDFVSNVAVDGDNDIVTVTFPEEYCWAGCWSSADKAWITKRIGTNIAWQDARALGVHFFPLGHYGTRVMLVNNIPNGTTITASFSMSNLYYDVDSGTEGFSIYYFDRNGSQIGNEVVGTTPMLDGDTVTLSYDLDFPTGTHSISICALLTCQAKNDTDMPMIKLLDFSMQMSISSLYRLQEKTGVSNALLGEVSEQLAEQGKTLDDILASQGQTNEKLDGIQDSVDELPGQIGDEFQGVIDQENEKAESEGNEMVDQVIQVIPDPSADLLPALQNLVSVMSYEGTECKLVSPPIKIPEIQGMFSETVILGPQTIDLEEWVDRIPKEIMALIWALFDCALVYFCVKEFIELMSGLVSGFTNLGKELEDG